MQSVILRHLFGSVRMQDILSIFVVYLIPTRQMSNRTTVQLILKPLISDRLTLFNPNCCQCRPQHCHT